MVREDTSYKLSLLTERQVEVLRLVCGGHNYKAIGEELYIAESTVKAHMGNIYQKLNLDQLPPNQRTKTIIEIYCPALREAPPPPSSGPEEPESVPETVEKMVEEDEQALVIWEPKPLVEIEPIEIKPTARPRRLRWTLFGMILGAILMAAPFYALRDTLFETPGEAAASAPLVEQVEVTVEKLVIVTTTPDTKLSPPTPVIQEVVVVVTATSAPTPTDLPITPADAILEIGDWWKGEGVWLRVSRVEFEDWGYIYIDLDLWNKTEHSLMFEWSGVKNFSLRDNTGYYYLISDVSSVDLSEIIEAGELVTLRNGYGSGVEFDDNNFFDTAVTDLYITVIELPHVPLATWHITIPK